MRLIAITLAAAAVLAAAVSRPQFDVQDSTGTTEEIEVARYMGDNTVSCFEIAVTGSPTTCTYQVEGSISGDNWFYLESPGEAAKDCTSSVLYCVDGMTFDYLRGNLVSLAGGSSPTVQLIPKLVSK